MDKAKDSLDYPPNSGFHPLSLPSTPPPPNNHCYAFGMGSSEPLKIYSHTYTVREDV